MAKKRRKVKVKQERIMQPIYKKNDVPPTSEPPEFKPGKKLSLRYGKELLNGKVKWQQVAISIIEAGYTKAELALEMKLSLEDIYKVCEGDLSPLNFRLGARLLAIHFRMLPHLWP